MGVVIASADVEFANSCKLLYLHGFPTKGFIMDLVIKIQSYTNSQITPIFKICTSLKHRLLASLGLFSTHQITGVVV